MFTKSTDWFEEVKGWKSTQGGFSAIQQYSTDQNNMGGFFVRKMAGAAGSVVHIQKILPLLLHPTGAQWAMGHFKPMLSTAVVANMMLAAFYACYLPDLVAAGAGNMAYGFLALLGVETAVIAGYLFTARRNKRGPAVAMPEGKTPSSFTSRIVARTIMMVSSVIAVMCLRDLFFPGHIFEFFPRDDIWLEWTNVFLHSPPDGSEEEVDQGLSAPLYVGDKFVSQMMAVNLLILCLYKFVSCFVRFGSDGGGAIKCRMIWQVQTIGDFFVTFIFRLFTPAATSASLDLRWHLMCLAYETFILGTLRRCCCCCFVALVQAFVHAFISLFKTLVCFCFILQACTAFSKAVDLSYRRHSNTIGYRFIPRADIVASL